jgi:nicotinamide riboside transporter PnuC
VGNQDVLLSLNDYSMVICVKIPVILFNSFVLSKFTTIKLSIEKGAVKTVVSEINGLSSSHMKSEEKSIASVFRVVQFVGFIFVIFQVSHCQNILTVVLLL